MATEVIASEQPARRRFAPCELSDSACATSSVASRGLGCGCSAARSKPTSVQPINASTTRRARLGDDEPAASDADAAGAAVERGISLPHRARSQTRIRPTRHPLGSVSSSHRGCRTFFGAAPRTISCSRCFEWVAAERGGALSRRRSHARRPEVGAPRRELRRPVARRARGLVASRWLAVRQVVPANGARRQPGDPPLFLRLPAERAFVVRVSESGRQLRRRALAYFYGMPTDATDVGRFERVDCFNDQRAGFFGLAGFLSVTSLDRRTSPSRRGRWIASNLLCRSRHRHRRSCRCSTIHRAPPVTRRPPTFDKPSSSIGRTRAAPPAIRCSIRTASRSSSSTPSASIARPTTTARPVDASTDVAGFGRAPRRIDLRGIRRAARRPSRPTLTSARAWPGSCSRTVSGGPSPPATSVTSSRRVASGSPLDRPRASLA